MFITLLLNSDVLQSTLIYALFIDVCCHADYCSIDSAADVLFSLITSMLLCVVFLIMTATISFCIVSVIVIQTYKIPLWLWYVSYRSYMYTSMFTIEMCLSINSVSVLVNTQKH